MVSTPKRNILSGRKQPDHGTDDVTIKYGDAKRGKVYRATALLDILEDCAPQHFRAIFFNTQAVALSPLFWQP